MRCGHLFGLDQLCQALQAISALGFLNIYYCIQLVKGAAQQGSCPLTGRLLVGEFRQY